VSLRQFLERVRPASGDKAVIDELRPLFSGIDEEHGAVRESLAFALLRDFGPADLPLVRALFVAETERACALHDGCGDPLYALCFMLYLLGEKDDVFLIYQAKFSSMDAGCMIDGQMLTMHRDAANMVAFLEEKFAADPGLRAKYPHLQRIIQELLEDPPYPSDDAFCASM